MADETKIPGADETPAPETHTPETLGGLSSGGHEEQGIIPGMGDNSVSTGKVVDLTATRAAAEKKDQLTVEDAVSKCKDELSRP